MLFKSALERVLLVLSLTATVYSQRKNEGDSCYESHTRTSGVCRRSNQCSTAYSAYANFNIRFDLCGYWFDTPIVCCVENLSQDNNRWPGSQTPSRPTQSRPTQTQSRPTQNRPSATPTRTQATSMTTNNEPKKRICEEKCDEYSASVTLTYGVIALLPDPDVTTFKQPQCNYTANPLVVGGKEAELGEFPHMAALGWEKTNGPGYAWLCGGSLISERYVLTAGHCTYQKGGTDAESGPPKVVRLGDHDLRDDVEDGAMPITVVIANIIKNPGYRSPVKYHDIALLKLAENVEFNNFVRPACIYSDTRLRERSVIATGWGTTANKAKVTSNILRKVSLKVFTNEECQPNFEQSRNWKNGFSNDQMCAGDENGGKDTCQGDSGGPLQVESPDNPCLFYIVGVTGFGGECGSSKGSGVYAVVSHYVDWIEQVVWG